MMNVPFSFSFFTCSAAVAAHSCWNSPPRSARLLAACGATLKPSRT
jgi:hypothetical protein